MAVIIEVIKPIIKLMAKLLMLVSLKENKIIATIKVVTFASTMVAKARLYPASILARWRHP